MKEQKSKITGLSGKKLGTHGIRDAKAAIKGNTFKKSDLDPHRILGNKPKMRAKTK